ncbi:GspH/FimT family pseudopilin [Saccharospirillum impatiens]|uniref:GspH/FimT family pseudopilin n=1 Tax=Saccharospirillum impatiens TaxID=169438 RepID=UPI00048C0915|nr:GspH/FimT family pseudopilin [Saccharospirillum impatiens]
MKTGVKNKGATLLELVITTSILGISASIALPAFQTMIDRHSAKAQQWEWVSLLKTARSAAVSQRQWVTVCPMANDQCTGDLNNPWIAFFDSTRSNRIVTPQAIIKQLNIPDSTRLKMYKGNTTLPYFRYRASGLSGNLRSLTVCPEGTETSNTFHFTSTHLGHIRFVKDSDKDGLVDRMYQGRRQNVTCT